MIPDNKTNFLYLADTLPGRHPSFYKEFTGALQNYKVKFDLLPHTKDIWALDYMPIQIAKNEFVRFTFDPCYLKDEEYSDTLSDTDLICQRIGMDTIKSDIIIDGGNVVRYEDQVIMTERIFKENPKYEKKQLLDEIKELLEIEHLYLIPEQPKDFTGHSDGMVRFLNDKTLLINDYQFESRKFQEAFKKTIQKTGLDCRTIPYNPYDNKTCDHANGDYINYLEMAGLIFVPIFNMKEDEEVVKIFESLFIDREIITINANDIADKGGVLHCISWNILV